MSKGANDASSGSGKDLDSFTSHWAELASSGQKLHYLKSAPSPLAEKATPLIALHGLGGYVHSVFTYI